MSPSGDINYICLLIDALSETGQRVAVGEPSPCLEMTLLTRLTGGQMADDRSTERYCAGPHLIARRRPSI